MFFNDKMLCIYPHISAIKYPKRSIILNPQERVGYSKSSDSFRLTVVGVMNKLDVLDTLNIYSLW